MSTIQKTIVTVIASFSFGLPVVAQNLLSNGNFELPSIATNTTSTITATDWVMSGGQFVNLHNGNSGNPSVFPLPQDGQQFSNIGNAPGAFFASQSFTIANPGTYTLQWYDSSPHVSGFTSAKYLVEVLTGVNQTVVTKNYDAYHATFGMWELRTVQLFLGAGVYTLRFGSAGIVNGLDSLIDNVSLTFQQGSSGQDVQAKIAFSAVDVCWAGLVNQMYQVQYSTNLTEWFDLGSPVAGTGANSITDRIVGQERRFYKVVKVP